MIEAYAMILWIGGSPHPTPHMVFDPYAIKTDTWDQCVAGIHNFDPGLDEPEIETAIAWCIEKDASGKIIRTERVIRK